MSSITVLRCTPASGRALLGSWGGVHPDRRPEWRGTPEAIANFYKLTPRELRVLLAVTELSSIAETAYNLDISENTVRTHMKRIYAKTGASRLSDLVKLKLRFGR
jgi:DNA-binding CsgD family transcriptional regulator